MPYIVFNQVNIQNILFLYSIYIIYILFNYSITFSHHHLAMYLLSLIGSALAQHPILDIQESTLLDTSEQTLIQETINHAIIDWIILLMMITMLTGDLTGPMNSSFMRIE